MYISSCLEGLAHPLNGVDHILAMVAIGLWAVVAGGRALWAWPAAFVAMVLVGFVATKAAGQAHSARPPATTAHSPIATMARMWSAPLRGCASPSRKLLMYMIAP